MVEGQTEYLNCRAVNPHRIEVRGAYGLVVTIHTQDKQELITALADGGIEQKLQTLNGVRSTAVLEKLVTVEGELVFAKPPAAILDITGSAAVAGGKAGWRARQWSRARYVPNAPGARKAKAACKVRRHPCRSIRWWIWKA